MYVHLCFVPETIQLKEVLATMDLVNEEKKPIPFAITFYTADEERDTGGEKIEVKQQIATKVRKFALPDAEHVNKLGEPAKSKSPMHSFHSTRNINIPGYDHPVKLHIRLITHFNGKRVIW